MKISKLFMLAIVATVTLAQESTSPESVQLFEYVSPEHEVQVAYIVRLSEYIMTKQQWLRKFDPSACPETSILVCPPGSLNDCKPTDPVDPPNVCDLETHLQDEDCQPGGTCEELGTCPIPICEVPVELRVEEAGNLLCEVDFCKDPANAESAECKPVNRCDLEIYANYLEECKEPEDPDVSYCEKYPHLCISICDVTGDYEPCAHDYCKVFPEAPYCIEHPPPEPCTVDNQNVVDGQCCLSESCTTPETQCKWGFQIGERLMTEVGEVQFTNSSTKDVDGNIILSCLNEVTVTHKQNLVIMCFSEGLQEGFTAIEEGQIDHFIYSNIQEGDTHTVSRSEDGNQINVEYKNERRDVLSF